jgi:hypothetical protein
MNKNQFRKKQSLMFAVRRSIAHGKVFSYKSTNDYQKYKNKYHTLIIDKTWCNNERAVSQFSFEGNIQNVETLNDIEVQFKIQDLFYS